MATDFVVEIVLATVFTVEVTLATELVFGFVSGSGVEVVVSITSGVVETGHIHMFIKFIKIQKSVVNCTHLSFQNR